MSIFDGIISNTIYILFPLGIYLIYSAYAKACDLDEKKYFLEFALFSSIYMLIRYGTLFRTLYPALLFTIPLLISYIKNKNKTAIIISIILIYFNYSFFKFNIVLLIIEYISYYLFYFIFNKRKDSLVKITNSFIVIRTFSISYQTCLYIMPNSSYKEIIYYIIISSIIFAFISYMIIYLYNKAENVMNYSSTLNELNREKEIKASLFKITHEVKNPLAVCRGYLDILEAQDKKDYSKYIPIISSEINRTLNLMDDFLDYTKIKIDTEDSDVYLLLDEIKDSLIPLLKEKDIKYKFNIPDDELYLDLDYNRMKQVLINIYKNSIEAKKDNMKIVLSTKVRNNYLIIEVKDNGIGMDKDVLEKIGENFYTTKTNGTGLGVSLSKEIINLHGGSLSYKSKKNIGTTAIIKLPIKKEE